MLTQQENELLTQTSRGTPGGELLRRYWHPIGVAAELTPERPKQRVRLLGEDLILYRDPDGGFGLVGEMCLHRGASLYYGFLEDGGIRCPFHGWLYDRGGHCLEQPFEPAESMLKHTIQLPAYPVEKVRGLLFAYLGPLPAPVIPPWDVFVREDGTHHIEVHPILNCNWLQMQETNLDPTHNTFLHEKQAFLNGTRSAWQFRSLELDFELCEWGVIKRRQFLGEGSYKEEGHPAIFPNILRRSAGDGPIDLQFRTPVDDTHSRSYRLMFEPTADGSIVEASEDPPFEHIELKDGEGYFHMQATDSQDSMTWETVGPIRDRSIERLGVADKGVVLWRQLLKENIEKVKRGEDPIGIIRDPEKYKIIVFSNTK